MAFNGAFTIAVTSDPSTFVLTDTSVGSDTNLTGRTVYLYQASSQLLVSAISWPLANNTININVLDKDYALNVVVDWQSSSPLPSPSTYSYSLIYAFIGYAMQFLYQLTQNQTSQPAIIDDKDYYYNKGVLITEMDSAINAISPGGDLFAAQSCINRYQLLINNQTYFF